MTATEHLQEDPRGVAWELVAAVVDFHRLQEESGQTQCACGWDGELGTTYPAHVTDAVMAALLEGGYSIVAQADPPGVEGGRGTPAQPTTTVASETPSAAGEWRASHSGTVAHYYPAAAITADGRPLCGFDLAYQGSVSPERQRTDLGHVQMCEDCRELVGLLAS